MSSNTPLTGLERLAIAAIILTWGLNNAAAKVATAELPPMMVGALRFALALAFLVPFLKPPFPWSRRLMAICLLSGPIHFGIIYIAFGLAKSLSPLVVATQLWIPFTALFAWKMLGETMKPLAVAGLVVAFVGVAWMSLDPHGAADLPAIVLGVVASACWALATVFVRQTPGAKPLQVQALTAVVAAPVLLVMSFGFEDNVVERVKTAAPIAWACVAFAGVVSTIGASALLFWLVQRREAGRVTPYFLLTPLVSCTIGVLFMGDKLSPQLVIGAAATMAGVALVALTAKKVVPAEGEAT
ncbi:multidrug DMT transporter permease [Caulobacter sp. Root1455]|uniref:DMT family transporter n=1 Tax=unclassified Caulobacter TaxID=2648921 RepID=UPI0006F9208B|nr:MULTISPECIES: DMT family transporter [unclassified Caulobacter]KQY29846.1 multidrug DMT transporter permease [Caulobacter sp. Root487D2Y]KQZ05854.1 multidrug DMT transporter permease [Caulobacter sp. Root1455]